MTQRERLVADKDKTVWGPQKSPSTLTRVILKINKTQRIGLWPKPVPTVHPHGEVCCSCNHTCVISVHVNVRKVWKEGSPEGLVIAVFAHMEKGLEGCTPKWYHRRLMFRGGIWGDFFFYTFLSSECFILCINNIHTF